MANSLLDFVMSLVRDPDAAAHYAADPEGAIAAAHLANVTSADVNNLIPMAADSISMATPGVGGATAAESNVWTSGAATAAFDAFDAFTTHTAADPAGHDTGADGAGVIVQPEDPGQPLTADIESDHLAGLAVTDPSAPADGAGLVHQPLDEPAQQWPGHEGWGDSHADTHADTHTDDAHAGGDHPSFDLF